MGTCCFGLLALSSRKPLKELFEVLPASDRVRMAGTESTRENPTRPAKELSRPIGFSARVAADGKVVQRERKVRVTWSEALLLYRRRKLVEPFGGASVPALLPDGGEVVVRDGDFVMRRSVFSSEDLEDAAVDQFRLLELALTFEQRGERRFVRCDVRMVRPQDASPDFHGPAGERLAMRVTPALVLQS